MIIAINMVKVYLKYGDVYEVLFPGYDNSYYLSEADLGYTAIEWLIKNGEHVPTLYHEDTLIKLLQQVRQEAKMIRVKGGAP